MNTADSTVVFLTLTLAGALLAMKAMALIIH
jgi:hypothetical protein